MTRGAAESEVYNLLEYSMPPEEAVCALYQSNNASHLLEEDYESFSNWDSELPPPKIDDWIEFTPSDGKIEIRDKAQNLISASTPHCVYCIQIEYKYPSLQSLEREANVLFDEIPHWLRTAWDTEIALYVGYSSNFPDRVVAHSVGKLSDTNSPAMVTALADIVGAGIVEKTSDKDHAMTVEEKYAENLRSTTDDENITVYQY